MRRGCVSPCLVVILLSFPSFNSALGLFKFYSTYLSLSCEAIDTLLAMKGKLMKEEKRHLDDARWDKQVKEHAIQQVEELPPIRSSSRSHKPGLSQRLSPLRLFCLPPRCVVYALESQTKGDLLESTPLLLAPLVLAAYSLLQAPVVQVADLQAFLLQRSVGRLCACPHRPDLQAYFLLGRVDFFSRPSRRARLP